MGTSIIFGAVFQQCADVVQALLRLGSEVGTSEAQSVSLFLTREDHAIT